MSSPTSAEVNEAERVVTPSLSNASRRSLSSRAASTSRPGSVDQGGYEQLAPAARGKRSGQSDERIEAALTELREHDRALEARQRSRDRRRTQRRRQRRIVLQDRALELLQTRARVEPELIGQRAPRLSQDGERLDGSSGPVEGHRKVRPQRLAQRVLGDERAQLADQLRVVAARELGLDAALDRVEPHLIEPQRLGHEAGRPPRCLPGRARARGPAPLANEADASCGRPSRNSSAPVDASCSKRSTSRPARSTRST